MLVVFDNVCPGYLPPPSYDEVMHEGDSVTRAPVHE